MLLLAAVQLQDQSYKRASMTSHVLALYREPVQGEGSLAPPQQLPLESYRLRVQRTEHMPLLHRGRKVDHHSLPIIPFTLFDTCSVEMKSLKWAWGGERAEGWKREATRLETKSPSFLSLWPLKSSA